MTTQDSILAKIAAKKGKKTQPRNGKPRNGSSNRTGAPLLDTTGKPTVEKARKTTRPASVSVPWEKIAKLYEDGKSTSEISDTLGLTRPKTKDGKENLYPYYLVVGYLTKLSHGVQVNGQIIKIKRGIDRKGNRHNLPK